MNRHLVVWRWSAEQEAASSILARRHHARPREAQVGVDKNFWRPASSASAIFRCPAGLPAIWASLGLVTNNGSTRAPGIWLGLSTQPGDNGPSSMRWL